MKLNDYASFTSDYGWQIGTVSAILLYLIYWHRRPKRLPPGPRGLPIVGYLPFFRNRTERVAYDLSKKYGKILTIRMGTKDAVFLNDYESIRLVSRVHVILKFASVAHKNKLLLLKTLTFIHRVKQEWRNFYFLDPFMQFLYKNAFYFFTFFVLNYHMLIYVTKIYAARSGFKNYFTLFVIFLLNR